MATTLDFYTTAGLTTPLATLAAAQAADGSSAAVDIVVYLGSTAANMKFRADSNPGTDHLYVTVADANGGAGSPASAIKLATTAGGLASAVGGMALDLGTQLLSGVGNVQAVHVRIDTPALAVGKYTDLSLTTNTVREEAQ